MSIYGHVLESSINESLKDVIDNGPYMRKRGEMKRFIKDLLKKRKKEKTVEQKQKEETIKEKIDKLDPQKQKELQEKMYQDWNKLIIDLKSCYSKIKNTSEFKEKCKESINKLNEWVNDSEHPYKSGSTPNINISEFDEPDKYGCEGIIIIIDDDQEVSIIFNWIIDDIVDMYKSLNPDESKKWRFGFGDGDEGCLYPYYNFNL